MVDYITIRIKTDTHSRLKKYLHKKELDSIDETINAALDIAERTESK